MIIIPQTSTEDEKRRDFQNRSDAWNEMVKREVHVVGLKYSRPKLEGHRFIESKPHTWLVFGKPDGVSKTAVVYVFEKIA
jgi:hypothetical protein